MAGDDPRQLEVLLVEGFGFGGAEGERADDAAVHAERDDEHRDLVLVHAPQVWSPIEVVHVHRTTAHDRLTRESSVDRKLARLRYKPATVTVI